MPLVFDLKVRLGTHESDIARVDRRSCFNELVRSLSARRAVEHTPTATSMRQTVNIAFHCAFQANHTLEVIYEIRVAISMELHVRKAPLLYVRLSFVKPQIIK